MRLQTMVGASRPNVNRQAGDLRVHRSVRWQAEVERGSLVVQRYARDRLSGAAVPKPLLSRAVQGRHNVGDLRKLLCGEEQKMQPQPAFQESHLPGAAQLQLRESGSFPIAEDHASLSEPTVQPEPTVRQLQVASPLGDHAPKLHLGVVQPDVPLEFAYAENRELPGCQRR